MQIRLDGIWVVIGVGAGTGAVTAGTNSVIAQTGENFAGFDNVNWAMVGTDSAIGGISGAASAGVGYWASSSSLVVNGISSPVLRSAVTSPVGAGAGHVAGGTASNLIMGQSFDDAFANSFNGIGQSMAIGGAIGVASTVGVCYANGVNPWSGEVLRNTTKGGGKTFFEGAKYSDKVLSQMNNSDDIFHGFPKSVDGYAAEFGQWSVHVGADGKVYHWLKMPGSYGGKTGTFDYIKNPVTGEINHRFFNVP